MSRQQAGRRVLQAAVDVWYGTGVEAGRRGEAVMAYAAAGGNGKRCCRAVKHQVPRWCYAS